MSKEYKKVRDNKNYMFAEFRSKKEYQEAYKSVINNTLNADQFELVVFIERLRTTMLIERESNGKK
jgi:hypothetical protein